MENKIEVWKDIEGYEGLYQVSTLGNVKSLNYNHTGKERLLKPNKSNNGYLYINLYKNKKRKHCTLHRLVTITFLENPNNYPYINHKNEIKTDNRVENLEWVSPKENANYGTANKRRSEKMKGKPKSEEHKQKMSEARKGKISPKRKPIIQFTLSGEFIREWDSATTVSKELNISQGHISDCCNNKRKTVGGYIWRYK